MFEYTHTQTYTPTCTCIERVAQIVYTKFAEHWRKRQTPETTGPGQFACAQAKMLIRFSSLFCECASEPPDDAQNKKCRIFASFCVGVGVHLKR